MLLIKVPKPIMIVEVDEDADPEVCVGCDRITEDIKYLFNDDELISKPLFS